MKSTAMILINRQANNQVKQILPVTSMLLFVLFFVCNACFGQATTNAKTGPDVKMVTAGPEYKRSGLHNFLWGKHYRPEWATSVAIKVVMLDTLKGGLKPIKKGGGRQTKTLRLQDVSGKEYVLRSINKTFTKALPPVFQGTFIEAIANDQVSISHPYSALTIPLLAEAAGVYHTNPEIVFVPDQESLQEFREEFKDQLYLFEERPNGFQNETAGLGKAEDVDGTEKVLRKIFEENDHRVDQPAFVKARLFDMFLGDWGRHEDQWRWAEFDEGGVKVYRPIPRDRDQAYTKFDGLLVGVGTEAGNLAYLQSVDYTIKDVEGHNFQARHLDRQLANEPSLQEWIAIAKALQVSLSDQVITDAIHLLPSEVYGFSGQELIDKLISRRNNLVEFATTYYHVLAKQVDVVGSANNEIFEVTALGDNEVKVDIFDLTKKGAQREKPYYSRIFHSNETEEVRLYGLNGTDSFVVKGIGGKKIEVRLIGGPIKDAYTVSQSFTGKVKVYDDSQNTFDTPKSAKMKLSNDTAIHLFDYNAFKPDLRKVKMGVSYNNEDRLFVQLGYRIQRQQWRKKPFGYQADINLNYSVTQRAFSLEYKGVYNKIAGEWNLGMLAQYDAIRDQHFLGVGNNSKNVSDNPDFSRYTNHETTGALRLFRNFGTKQRLTFTGLYQAVELLEHSDRYISLTYGQNNKTAFEVNKFAGAKADYEFSSINHKYFPTSGFDVASGLEFTQNLTTPDRSVTRFYGEFGIYLPVLKNVTFAIKTGGATLWGTPEFYQMNKIGSGRTLRGFMRYRFYGKTSFYNQNELQWNFNVKTYLFSGKMGFLALLDNGRVWQPGENSNLWHVGVGGGAMIAPFNKMSLTATVAKSKEDLRFNVRLGKLL